MPLHLKFRPKTFDEFVGNKPTIEALKSVLSKDDIPHTWLFIGPTGCGKSTLARILTNELGCSSFDFQEVNASNNRGIETARNIIKTMVYKPRAGKVRVFLLEECHMTTKEYQNALLRAFEDTPEHVHFILCTTNPEKLLKTIRNRCSTYTVQKLPENRMARLLKKVVEEEKKNTELNYDVSDEAIKLICNSADGCPRQALVLLDQIIGLDENQQTKMIQEEIIREKVIKDLCQALMDEGTNWKKVAAILKGIEEEPEKIRWAVLGWFDKVMLNNVGNKAKSAAFIIDCFEEPFYNTGKTGLDRACYAVVNG